MTAPVGAPRRSMILDQSIKVLYHSILVLALYFEFAGHNLPGGGFVGGLIAGAAVSLRYVSGGAEAVRTTFRVPSHVILGLGLFLSSATALVPVLLGGAVLEHASYEMKLPIFGTVKVVSALPFDAGVFLVVVGLVLMAFAAFGDDRAPNETDVEAAQ
ncbi:MAG: multisubunit Na+/H+ antiporter MnhB subunit [Candidatus Azotimanducaceae bacterium]|jgi:multisubunit Na+/H+ antiporter MnhB subunit|tara:strand:- start:256 stop:729 length:474 start_codon:yes stop_codon:yes gene_type:complete